VCPFNAPDIGIGRKNWHRAVWYSFRRPKLTL
jgi:hypothetical protein